MRAPLSGNMHLRTLPGFIPNSPCSLSTTQSLGSSAESRAARVRNPARSYWPYPIRDARLRAPVIRSTAPPISAGYGRERRAPHGPLRLMPARLPCRHASLPARPFRRRQSAHPTPTTQVVFPVPEESSALRNFRNPTLPGLAPIAHCRLGPLVGRFLEPAVAGSPTPSRMIYGQSFDASFSLARVPAR